MVAPVTAGVAMKITYNTKTDLLYIRLADRRHELINRRVSEDIVLDIGEGGKIVGIEIADASHHLNLNELLPVEGKPRRHGDTEPSRRKVH